MYDNIKAEMARKGDTRKDVADCLGITETSVYRRFSGETEWSLSDMRTLAKRYDVSIDYLAGMPA